MKKVIILTLCALVFLTAQYNQQGEKNVAVNWIFWDPGSTDTDSTTKIVVNNSQILADSSGTWKRIDNSADSCSYPFYLTDNQGVLQPTSFQVFNIKIESDEADSNQIKFDIETRELIQIRLGTTYSFKSQWTEWVKVGAENGTGVVDTIQTEVTGLTSAIRQKHRVNVTGVQARLCANIPSVASAEAIDTTYYDSIIYFGR